MKCAHDRKEAPGDFGRKFGRGALDHQSLPLRIEKFAQSRVRAEPVPRGSELTHAIHAVFAAASVRDARLIQEEGGAFRRRY